MVKALELSAETVGNILSGLFEETPNVVVPEQAASDTAPEADQSGVGTETDTAPVAGETVIDTGPDLVGEGVETVVTVENAPGAELPPVIQSGTPVAASVTDPVVVVPSSNATVAESDANTSSGSASESNGGN